MTKEEIAEAVVVGAGRGAAEGERAGGKKGAAFDKNAFVTPLGNRVASAVRDIC